MEPVKKSEIRKDIYETEIQIEIEAVIRTMVDKFKHYKQVNKRFSDAFSEIEGYRAWIYNEHRHALHVVKSVGEFKSVTVQLYVYGESLTWDKILSDLDRHNFKGRLERYKANLDKLDSEIETLKEIRDYIGDRELTNFSLFRITCELDHAINRSGE